MIVTVLRRVEVIETARGMVDRGTTVELTIGLVPARTGVETRTGEVTPILGTTGEEDLRLLGDLGDLLALHRGEAEVVEADTRAHLVQDVEVTDTTAIERRESLLPRELDWAVTSTAPLAKKTSSLVDTTKQLSGPFCVCFENSVLLPSP